MSKEPANAIDVKVFDEDDEPDDWFVSQYPSFSRKAQSNINNRDKRIFSTGCFSNLAGPKMWCKEITKLM